MKKLSIIILSISFVILALGVSLFFYFRNKNNTNSDSINQNLEQNSQIIDQNIDVSDKNENKSSNGKQNINNLEKKNNETRNITIQKLTHYEQFDEKFLKIKIEIEYPVLSNKNHSDFIDKINKENKLEAEKDFNEYKSQLQKIAKDSIKYDSYNDIFYYQRCEITRNDNIISMHMHYAYCLGGSIFDGPNSKNYDLKNNKKLTIGDILSGNKKNINKMIGKKVTEYFKSSGENKNFDDYFKNYNLKDYVFHIENKNSQDILVIDFAKYELDARVLGALSIEIPFSEIKQKYKIGLKI